MVVSDPATGVSYWGNMNNTVYRVDPNGVVKSLTLPFTGAINTPIVSTGIVDSVNQFVFSF